MTEMLNIRLDESAHTRLSVHLHEIDIKRTDTSRVYVIHPKTGNIVEIDPDQAWFWTSSWQAGEREVDEDLTAGKYEEFGSIEEFFDTL